MTPDGRPYYLNHNTQTTSWSRPDAGSFSPSAPSPSSSWNGSSSSLSSLSSSTVGAPSYAANNNNSNNSNGYASTMTSAPPQQLMAPQPIIGGNLSEQKPLWLDRKAEAVGAEAGCAQCNAAFGTVVSRRHHCRSCQRAYCDAHSRKVHAVPQFGHPSPVRVCDACHRHLSRNDNHCMPRLVPYLSLGGGRDPLALRAVDEIYNLVQQRDPATASADVLESAAIAPLVKLLSLLFAPPDGRSYGTVVQHAARTLATLAERDANVAQVIADAGGMSAAVALLQRDVNDDTRIEATRLLSHVARLAPWRERVYAAALPSLMALLDATQTNSERLHEWAARTLRNLLTESPENRRAFGAGSNGEGLFLLTTLLGSDNAALAEHVTLSLQALADQADCRARLVAAGAAEQLARSLGHPVPAVQRSALAALAQLSSHPDAGRAIVRAQGVPLLGGMLQHAMDDHVQESVLRILQHLLDQEDCSIATGRELLFGSLAALVGVLRSQNVQVQRAALPMLRLLVIFDEQGKELIGQSGALEHLIRIFASQTENSRDALNTITFLAADHDANADKILEHGGVDVIAEMLNRPNVEQVVEALNALRAITTSARIVGAVQQRTVRQLVSLVTDSASPDVVNTALGVLSNVAGNARGAPAALCQAGAPQALAGVLQRAHGQLARGVAADAASAAAVGDARLVPALRCTMHIAEWQRDHLVQAGVTQALGALLCDAVDGAALSTDVQRELVLAVRACARLSRARLSMQESGAVRGLVRMAARATDPDTRAAAAEAVGEFAAEPSLREELRRNDGVGVLVELLFADRDASRRHAVGALSQFSFGGAGSDAGDTDKLLAAGGVLALINLLDDKNNDTADAAALTLGNLARVARCRFAILQSDVLAPVERLMGRAALVTRAAWLLSMLSYEASFGAALAGRVSLLLQLVPLVAAATHVGAALEGAGASAAADNDSDPSRVAVFALVNACASSDVVWPKFVELGGIAPLVGLLASGNVQAQHMALDWALKRTSQGDAAFTRGMASEGGVAAVAQLFAGDERRPQTIGTGDAYEALTLKALAVLTAFSAHELAWPQLVSATLLRRIAATLVLGAPPRAGGSAATQQQQQQMHAQFQQLPAQVQQTVHTMRALAAEFVCNLSNSPEHCTPLIEQGVLSPVVELIFSPHTQLQSLAATALSHFALDQRHALAVQHAGGVVALITLMSSVIEAVQESVSAALVNLSREHACLQQILDNDGMRPIVRLLSARSVSTRIQALKLVGMLSASDDFCEVIERSGGAHSLLELVSSDSAEVRIQVLATLANLARWRRGRRTLLDGDALSVVLPLLPSAADLLPAAGAAAAALLHGDAADDLAAHNEHLPLASAPSAPLGDDDSDDDLDLPPRSSTSLKDASAPPDDAGARRRRPKSVYREQPIPENRDEAQRLVRTTALELVSRLAIARKARELLLASRDETVDALLAGVRSAAHAEASDPIGAAQQRHSLRCVAALAVDERGRAALAAHGVPAVLVQVLLQNSDRRVLLQALFALGRLLCDAAVCDELLDGPGYRAMLEFLAAGDDAIQAAAARALTVAANDRRAGALAAASKRVPAALAAGLIKAARAEPLEDAALVKAHIDASEYTLSAADLPACESLVALVTRLVSHRAVRVLLARALLDLGVDEIERPANSGALASVRDRALVLIDEIDDE